MVKKLREKKLNAELKRLQLEKVKDFDKKFIAIQMDGLAHPILKKAMEKGYAGFLRKLLEKEDYNITSYNCGIPSGTPAIQASIFYGKNDHIPSFRFMDKKKKKYYSFAKPGHVRKIEKEFFKNPGILVGGSSYSNLLSGGAERAILTMSKITSNKRLKRIKESDLWVLLLLNPISLWRVIYYTFAELFVETLSFLWNLLTGWMRKNKQIYKIWMPFRRFMFNAISAELITLGAIIDIKRGVPKIYMTYINYDDIAHMRGPECLESYFVIRSLDRRIRRIYKHAKKAGYDFYVLSDHGQTPGQTFKSQNSMKLSDFVQKCAKEKSFGLGEPERRASLIRVAMWKTLGAMAYLSAPVRWAAKAFIKSSMKMIKPQKYPFNWDDKKSIFVVDSCSLAQVYFNFSDKKTTIVEIEKRYPKLIEKLVRNKGIGLVLGHTKKGNMLIGKGGRIEFTDKKIKKEGKDVLKKFGEPEILIKQLRSFLKKKHMGDLILFGNLIGGVCTSFTDHVGCHGSFGGEMMEPFFISKEYKDLTHVIDAKELYKIFKKYSKND